MSAVYSVATLADRWDCGTDAVYSLIRSGELRAFKVGGKLLRIRMDEVERYECNPTNTASNDIEESSPSSGTKRANDTEFRLERLIERQPRPQLVRTGRDAS